MPNTTAHAAVRPNPSGLLVALNLSGVVLDHRFEEFKPPTFLKHPGSLSVTG
jgi:hypothetical protein